MDPNLLRTCRACLKNLVINGQKLSDSIKNPDSDTILTYLDAFLFCTGFAVDATDPQVICDECSSELLISFQFKEKCIKTQNKMKHWFERNVKQEEEIEIEDMVEVKLEVFADTIDNVPSPKNNKDNEIMNDKIVKGSKTEKCELCNKMYADWPNLLQHYSQKHKKTKTAICPHCKVKQYSPLLDAHIEKCRSKKKNMKQEQTKPEEMGLCPICGDIKSKNHITVHIRKQNGKSTRKEKIFICDICGNQLRSKHRLIDHMNIQHLHIPFKCPQCPLEFRTPLMLETHTRLIHPNDKSLIRCELCDFTTIHRACMRDHRNIHSNKRNYKCDICEKKFLSNTKLRNHRAIHFDERPFSCTICGSSFKSKRYLSMHKRVHQEKDYECPVCLKTFSANQLLTNHIKKTHPEYQLPPPGTIMKKSYRIKIAEKRLKQEALRQGLDKKIVDAIVVTEAPPLEELHMMQSF